MDCESYKSVVNVSLTDLKDISLDVGATVVATVLEIRGAAVVVAGSFGVSVKQQKGQNTETTVQESPNYNLVYCCKRGSS